MRVFCLQCIDDVRAVSNSCNICSNTKKYIDSIRQIHVCKTYQIQTSQYCTNYDFAILRKYKTISSISQKLRCDGGNGFNGGDGGGEVGRARQGDPQGCHQVLQHSWNGHSSLLVPLPRPGTVVDLVHPLLLLAIVTFLPHNLWTWIQIPLYLVFFKFFWLWCGFVAEMKKEVAREEVGLSSDTVWCV